VIVNQSCGSGFIESGTGSSISSVSGSGYGPGVLMSKPKLKKKNKDDNFFSSKIAVYLCPKLHEKPSAHLTLQNIKFINFFLCLCVIFALLDPDTDPGIPLKSGSTALL
jgi:hypothetical protein